MIETKRLTVCFRNFYRNKMVNLSAKSIKHFLPRANIHCVSLYKDTYDEYKDQEPLDNHIINIVAKTKYVNKNPDAVHDHVDTTKTSGYAHPDNGLWFSEGYNIIFNIFKQYDEPVVMLSEDHFFTTGAVLREIVENSYDIAYASGDRDINANGSLLVINPQKVKHLFPLPEVRVPIESLLETHLVSRVENRYSIKHRKWIDYCGDGIYTNSSADMIREMKASGII